MATFNLSGLVNKHRSVNAATTLLPNWYYSVSSSNTTYLLPSITALPVNTKVVIYPRVGFTGNAVRGFAGTENIVSPAGTVTTFNLIDVVEHTFIYNGVGWDVYK